MILALGGGGWWLWEHSNEGKDLINQYIENSEISTLESKYTPQQIMEIRRPELLGTGTKRTYQEPAFKYYPYLLLDVKYTEDKKTREGVLLWSFTDGEMVLNTQTWEKTHGFKDCLECKANRQDFKILQALASQGGALTLEDLQKRMNVERDILEPWVEESKQKHLVVQKGNLIQLHFENPKLLVAPQTQFNHHLVSKPLQNGQRVSKVYSRNQIIEIAKAAFGSDFKIRSEQEIYLPVYSIGVLNPDGSIHTSDWNAITAERIAPKYLSKAR
ncbi:MAG: hypothetical protein H0W88_04305 [Parachlamydiaceae bacterium]|nr:hypothetical protein [Parachlamydiaceae bacterium]